MRRRRNKGGPAEEVHDEDTTEKDLFDDEGELDEDKRIKLTLLEEVVLLGLKDQAVRRRSGCMVHAHVLTRCQ